MDKWTPLHNHTFYSLLTSPAKPKDIARRCTQLGYDACAMTDYANVGCAIDFMDNMGDVCSCSHQKGEHSNSGGCRLKVCDCSKFDSKPIKPILGLELNVCREDPTNKSGENQHTDYLTVLSKNLQGWKKLVKLTSFTNLKENIDGVPRTDLNGLGQFCDGNLLGFSGYPGSSLANIIFTDYRKAYLAKTEQGVRDCLHPDRQKILLNAVERHVEAFGRENFRLAAQELNPKDVPVQHILADAMRWAAKKLDIKVIATNNSHYVDKLYGLDQKILLCSSKKSTMNAVESVLLNDFNGRNVNLHKFIRDCNYHISSVEEMQTHHKEREIRQAYEVNEMCEFYDIRHSPMLPDFPNTGGLSQDKYLYNLCVEGFQRKIRGVVNDSEIEKYKARVKEELNVFKNAGLSSYFNIVSDIMKWSRARMLCGPGRGSSSGCLVSYLTDITTIDPIPPELLFSRFYNAGRNSPGKVSLPDIDNDFESYRRHEAIEYMKNLYGRDKVAQVATFNSLKGAGALTEVFRAHSIPYEVAKRITENIPDEARISEELQEMRDNGEEPSIIRYELENNRDVYSEWVVIGDDGKCEGEYSSEFEQAIRLEGVKKNISRHAAALSVSPFPLSEICPMSYDEKTGEYICCMEYTKLEAMGIPKIDFLSINALDKMAGVAKLLRYGYINEDD